MKEFLSNYKISLSILLLFLFTFSLKFIFIDGNLDVYSLESFKITFSIIASTISIMAFTYMLLNYLNFGNEKLRSLAKMSTVLGELEALNKKVDRDKNAIDTEALTKAFPKEKWEKVADNILEKAKQVTITEITNKATSVLSENLTRNRAKQLDQHFSRTYNRLNQEIDALGRRGNLNLAIGIITTVVGFIIFGILVFSISAKANEFSIVKDFLPRLSLVFLIELFAYFFLGLYKSSLTEIKYFQNEITNLETWHLSLQQAMILDDDETIKNLLERLASTERNFLLKKGESTVFLETENLSQNQQKTLIDNLASALIKAKHQEKSS